MRGGVVFREGAVLWRVAFLQGQSDTRGKQANAPTCRRRVPIGSVDAPQQAAITTFFLPPPSCLFRPSLTSGRQSQVTKIINNK